MTAPPSPTRPDETTRKTDLNLSRVAAAALAAVTAALVGSRLGAEGTLIGAGAASVVTTVATAIYQASLERSRERVRSLAHRTRPAAAAQSSGQPSDRLQRSSKLSWGMVVVGAFGGFVLAMMAITGFEWASGGTVGGNGKGTTIGHVVNDPAPQKPTPPPATPGPATPTPETSAKPTETSEPPATSTTAPNGDDSNDHSPTPSTANRPRPSEVTPPPLIPGLPGVGG